MTMNISVQTTKAAQIIAAKFLPDQL